MIYRRYTFGMRPTQEQSKKMFQIGGVCRLIWNMALEQRSSFHSQFKKQTGNTLNLFAQSAQLTQLRKESEFIRECPQECAFRSLSSLDAAYKAFFRSSAKEPKFKKKIFDCCFSFQGKSVNIKRINKKWFLVKLPKICCIKFKCKDFPKGKICDVFVKLQENNWNVSFSLKIDRDIADVGGVVGIDRGVAVPIQLSDGQSFAMPASLDKLDKRHRKAQRVASRRKRGSKRHAKAQQRVRNLAAKRARIRKDWAHKATTDIARQYGTVVIERLRTKNMTASGPRKRGLNRAILNVGWFQIEQMLTYKSYRLVKVNPAYSSQTCASCGAVDSKSRKNQASFVCTSCGHRDNADRNAAAVILQRGNTALLGVEGCSYAPVEAPTAVTATLRS